MRINIRDLKSARERRRALEKETKTKLPNIGEFSLNEEIASSRNCENMIGIAQVPMGAAGPLLTKNSKLKAESYYIPLATTEGALVASVNRGCKAITQSGGVNVFSENAGITRGPVFEVDSLQKGKELIDWLDKK